MKTSFRFLMYGVLALALSMTSCEKNESELYDLRDENTTAIEAINATAAQSLFGSNSEPIKLKIKRAVREGSVGKFGSNAMVSHNGQIWSVGGVNGTDVFNPTNEVWSSRDGNNWTLRTEGEFLKQRDHTLTVFQNEMWLIGKGIWKSSDGIKWKHMIKHPLFGHISSHNTVVFNNKLFVIKGDSVWSSGNGIDWRLETNRAFPHRHFHSAVVFNNAIYVSGGSTGLGNTPSNIIWKSTNGSQWTRVRTRGQIFGARSQHTSTVFNDKVFVIGGTVEGYAWSNEIWYSSDMISWQPHEGTIPFAEITSHQSLVFDNLLWNFGGWKHPTGITGEIWKIAEVR